MPGPKPSAAPCAQTDIPNFIRDHKALLPHATRDAVRLAPLGEHLALALHTGRNSILANRYSVSAGTFKRDWRILVEPGVAVGGRSTTSGTFDPFGGLHDQWQVLLDSDANGRLLAAGSSGYLQNPGGASISEEAKPLLLVLEGDGALREKLAASGGPRHNQVRPVAPHNGAWLGGSVENGPGTHSADADPALLRADGVVRGLRLP